MAGEPEGGPEQVRHLTAPGEAGLLACLEALLPPAVDARGLIDIGAVYVDRERAAPGQHDRRVRAGAYLRVHCSPRRFPEAARVDWKARVVADTEHYVLLDKPGGVPVHASLDNCVETALACTARALSEGACALRRPLHALHRLDVPTHGLLVMGKTARFTSHFNALMRDRRVHKEYRALTWRPPPLGRHVHYMENSRRSPKAVSVEPRDGWQDCVLVVHRVERKHSSELAPSALAVMREQLDRARAPTGDCAPGRGSAPDAGAVWGAAGGGGAQSAADSPLDCGGAYQVCIELHTGRTHQIRAQMAALGCPLVGDEMYGSLAPLVSPAPPKLVVGEEGAGDSGPSAAVGRGREGEDTGQASRGKKRPAGVMDEAADCPVDGVCAGLAGDGGGPGEQQPDVSLSQNASSQARDRRSAGGSGRGGAGGERETGGGAADAGGGAGGAGGGGAGGAGGGSARDEHGDKWLARKMEEQGSLALQAYKLSFSDLPAPPVAAHGPSPHASSAHASSVGQASSRDMSLKSVTGAVGSSGDGQGTAGGVGGGEGMEESGREGGDVGGGGGQDTARPSEGVGGPEGAEGGERYGGKGRGFQGGGDGGERGGQDRRKGSKGDTRQAEGAQCMQGMEQRSGEGVERCYELSAPWWLRRTGQTQRQ